MTDQNPHDGSTPADREHPDAFDDETSAHDHTVSSVPAGEHRSVPASAHANSGARESDAPRGADAPQYGVGPFSVREIALLGIWVVAFFVSFFRTNILDSPSGVLIGGMNVWLSGLWWIPTVALPTVAVGLLILRRLSPQGIRRVGSLGIDQFASVAFTVSAIVWVSWVWDTVAIFGETGIWTRSWVIWVEAVVLLAGVVLTVFGPIIPHFAQDFRGREEVPAHRSARPIRPVIARPRTPRVARAPRDPQHDAPEHTVSRPAAPVVEHDSDIPTPGSYTGSTDVTPDDAAPRTTVLPAAHADADNDTDVFAPLRADRDERRDDDPRPSHDDVRQDRGHDAHDDRDHPHAQAFWALAPAEREIVDDYGTPIFHIGPTAWALVVEDRGETFVVRHDDGRIGYLHDVSGVTRG
ncbi:hypothetical protein [Microbacterium sp. VKM Ac-2923]|uniref:hypothetical protein n=1 Tax=Microbacterium sp. VKM Ac-2923 TaxID=2929476 RepID=UPI001FB442CF|nr:hypothetical protein [Microbacterium sp. VKM Ac-2923]MCJ1707970.1 hypothetical protein [Microbacterium sp. VKM Ac-2923]